MTFRRSILHQTAGKLTRSRPLPDFALSARPMQKVEVTSLQVVQDYDPDCDPYNRTGRFLVAGMKKNS